MVGVSMLMEENDQGEIRESTEGMDEEGVIHDEL